MKKSGQVALERLFTYGFALGVIAIGIAILWYYYLSSPSSPSLCYFESYNTYFNCIGGTSFANSTKLILKIFADEKFVYSIENYSVYFNGKTVPCLPSDIEPGKIIKIACNVNNTLPKYKGYIEIDFLDQMNNKRTAKAIFSGETQK